MPAKPQNLTDLDCHGRKFVGRGLGGQQLHTCPQTTLTPRSQHKLVVGGTGSRLPALLLGAGAAATRARSPWSRAVCSDFIKFIFPSPFCTNICIYHQARQYLFSKVVLFKQGLSLLNSSTPISCGPRPSVELTLIIYMTVGLRQAARQAPP